MRVNDHILALDEQYLMGYANVSVTHWSIRYQFLLTCQ